MLRFDTIRHEEFEYGTNNFVEVALKRAHDETQPADPGTTFVSVSRGYKTARGERRYRMHFTCPPDVAARVAAALRTVSP